MKNFLKKCKEIKLFKNNIILMMILLFSVSIMPVIVAASTVTTMGTLNNVGDVVSISPTALGQLNFAISGLTSGSVIIAEESATGNTGTFTAIPVISQSGGRYKLAIIANDNYASAGVGYGYFQLRLSNQTGGIISVNIIAHGGNSNIVINGGNSVHYGLINTALGFAPGPTVTSTIYPPFQIANYINGKIEKLHVACSNSDSISSFTLTDVTDSIPVGTVTLNGNTTATTILSSPFSLIPGNVLQLTVNTGGTATNCAATAEGHYDLF